MKVEVTNPLKNNMAKTYKKVISIIVSFFISSKNYILDLLQRELINIY